MTDPLRPFARAIHSLWQTRSRDKSNAPNASESSASGAPEPRSPDSRLNETLQSRLQACMQRLNTTDPKRLREAFVETVLLWEIGDHLAPDPALGALVAGVAEQLASDPSVGMRLNQLLQQLSAQRRASPSATPSE